MTTLKTIKEYFDNMEILTETEFLRRTKKYIIKINDKEIELVKKWYIDDIAKEYDSDYEIIDKEKLTDDEMDELCDFIGDLD